MLIEALVAILIFSIGILAIVGLQATSVKLAADAKYRSDAGLLANQLIGQMWVANRSTLSTAFSSPSGSQYLTWVASSVQPNLPGVAGSLLPTVAVSGVAATASSMVTVTIRWQAPSETASSSVHNYVAIAQIR
jgi:type IV pilus assembly protein PilV